MVDHSQSIHNLNQSLLIFHLYFQHKVSSVITSYKKFTQFKVRDLMSHTQLKEGAVMTYHVLQNAITYQVRLTNTSKGLWMCIEDSGLNWKLTITSQMVQQTVSKASNSKQIMSLKQFTVYLLQAISKGSDKWSVGIMTPIELQVLRGGTPSKQANNNKIYLILSDKQKKLHYPFTFVMSDLGEKDKLIDAIKTMKSQLEELRAERNDKSQSSFSIMSQTYNMSEQVKMENEQLKRKIKMCEESLTQKRGAVEIDLILKEKNNLQIQAQTKKREEHKQITRLKNMYQLMDRQIKQVQAEVEMINRQILMLQDSVGNAAKIKSHAMKVLKSYENELRTQKKVLQKQVKQVETLKRNILNSKNNQRKVMTKIKQIQTEIDQCKKKTNIKQISNRLHSVGRGNNSNADSASSKSQSVGGSSTGKPSPIGVKKGPVNLVRQNLMKKNMPSSSSNRNNNLLKTSPNINMMVGTDMVKQTSDKGSGRAINSSHNPTYQNNGVNQRLFNTQKYRSGSKSENQNSSVRSDSAQKKKPTEEQKQRQRKAMERLTGPRAVVPKRPSIQKKTQPVNRLSSQNKLTNNSLNRAGSNKAGSLSKEQNSKKDSAKEMLLKMKQIKAHYNNQGTKNNVAKNFATKIAQLGDKKIN